MAECVKSLSTVKVVNQKSYLLWYLVPHNYYNYSILLGVFSEFSACLIQLLSHLYIRINYVDGKFMSTPHQYSDQGWTYSYPPYFSIDTSKDITDIDDMYITVVENNEVIGETSWIRVVGNKLVRTPADYPIYGEGKWESDSSYPIPKSGIFQDPKVEVIKMDHPAFTTFQFIRGDQYLVDNSLTLILLDIRGIHPKTPEAIRKKYLELQKYP